MATEEGALTCIEELHLKRMFVTENAARLLVQCHAQGLLANLKVRVHVADAAAEKPTCSAQQDRDLTHAAAAFPMYKRLTLMLICALPSVMQVLSLSATFVLGGEETMQLLQSTFGDVTKPRPGYGTYFGHRAEQ